MQPDRPTRDPQPADHRIVVGLVVVGIGVLALLDNLRLFDAALLRTFWPLALVLWGLARLIRWRQGSTLVSAALIGVGLALTAQKLGLMHFSLRDWWPVFIILAGLSILTRGMLPRPGRHAGALPGTPRANGELVDIDATFSAVKQRNDSTNFSGGRISSAFGGVELDLSQAVITGADARLDISARFSGVELRVPREWLVAVEIASTFGGVEDKTTPPMNPGPRLLLRGDVLFGGVEIKN